jgi:hypothetical protein
MPKVDVQANELTDGEVRYVSLVSRGANRIPFRITKSSEGEMDLDISKLFRRKGELAGLQGGIAPVVTKVVLPKTDAEGELDIQKTLITTLGFKADDVTEGDTYRSFKQADGELDEVALKLDEGIHLVVAHAKKSFMDLGGANEGNSFATQGFFPSFYNAMDMLSASVWDLMADANSSPEAAQKLELVATDFGNYMKTLISAIPETAWKADKEVQAIRVKRENAPAGTEESGIKKSDEAPTLEQILKSIVDGKLTKSVLEGLAKADSGEVAGYIAEITGMKVADITTVLGNPQAGGKLVADVSLNESADYAAGLGKPSTDNALSPATDAVDSEAFLKSDAGKGLLAAFGEIVKQTVAPIQETIEKMDGRLGTVEATATEAKELATKADGTLSTTLAGGSDTGDLEVRRETVRKGSGGPPPLLDTAFMRP